MVFSPLIGAGDKDTRDLIQMRLEHRRRQGLETESVFDKGVGQFEKHTKVGLLHFEPYNVGGLLDVLFDLKQKVCPFLHGQRLGLTSNTVL